MFNQAPSVDCRICLGQYFGWLYFDSSFTSWPDKRFHAATGITAIRLMNISRWVLPPSNGDELLLGRLRDWRVPELAAALSAFN